MTPLLLAENELCLLPQGAVWDPARKWLFMTDLHLGKVGHFQSAGLALPEGADDAIFSRLNRLLQHWQPSTLVLLGDVFHASAGGTQAAVEKLRLWRAENAGLTCCIVPGNHDRKVPWAHWWPEAQLFADGSTLGPWVLSHAPDADSTIGPRLCGHLHPGVALGLGRRQKRLRLPCFWLSGQTLILPAFGEFTGLKIVKRQPGDRVWAFTPDRVFEIPPELPD